MANVVLSDRYMDCPSNGCPKRIVKVLVCSGRENPLHKGLPFRSCDTCGYYSMLDEREAAAAGFTFPEANGPAQQEQGFANAMQALLFAAPPSINPHGIFTNRPSFPSSSLSANSRQVQCSIPRCKRKSAVECGLCKGCCEGRGTGCSSSRHRRGPPRTKKATSFAPEQLPAASPVFPSTTVASSTTNANANSLVAKPLPPHLFRDEMSESSFTEWKAREQVVEERRTAAELRKQNELSIAKQVVIQLWFENGSKPKVIRQQNISTYPTLNIAQIPSLMIKMGINSGAVLEIWNPRTKSWCIEDADHCMNIKGMPELLVRFLDVKDCPDFEHFIGEDIVSINNKKRHLDINSDTGYMDLPSHRHASTLRDFSRTSSSTVQTPTQARSASSLTYLSSSSLPSFPLHSEDVNGDTGYTNLPSHRHVSTLREFSQTPSSPIRMQTPALCPTSCPTSSPFSSVPSSPAFSESPLPLDFELSEPSTPTSSYDDETYPQHTVMNYDILWAQGYVYVPEGKSWPDGMYARDMAWAFTEMRKERKDVKARFRKVFPGAKWVKATYYRQLDAFIGSTAREIDQCRRLGRSPTGLWANWRGNSSGWAKVTESRKAKTM